MALLLAISAIGWLIGPSAAQIGYLTDPGIADRDNAPNPHPCGRAKQLRGQMLEEMLRDGDGPTILADLDATTDVQYYKLDITVAPATRTVSGASTITARSTIDGLTTFTAYLDRNGGQMTVSGITGNAASYTHSGDVITITLDRTYDTDEEFTVDISYAGRPRETGFGSFLWSSHGSGGNYGPSISSLSEPFFARTWWPCKDELVDKANTADIWISAPDNLIAASNGVLQGTDDLGGGWHRYRWYESNPIITYLVFLAVSNYGIYNTTYDHLGDSMPCTFYIFPEYNYVGSSDRQGCDQTVMTVEKYSDAFGQYPFVDEKFGMAMVAGSGAFMEHQTCPTMLTFSYESTDAHELAHQWWGDMVTCASWADIWLNEGFATWSEAIWFEHKPGGGLDDYLYYMTHSSYPGNIDEQVYRWNLDDVGHIFSSTVYDKGAWVVHMLRGALGETDFWRVIQEYRDRFEGLSAYTSDLAQVTSDVMGADWSFFFDQWVRNPGSPDYEYNWTDVSVNASKHYLQLGIWQRQNNRGYGLFVMPMQVKVTTGSGDHYFTIWNDDWEEAYVLQVDGAITNVQLDPAHWMLYHSRRKVSRPVPSSEPPSGWINTGWNWISVPVPPANPAVDATFTPNSEVVNNLFRWDPTAKTVELYPDDFTTLDWGRGYVLWVPLGGIVPTAKCIGLPAAGDVEVGLPNTGWTWIGHPQTSDVALADCSIRNDTTQQIRTVAQDQGAADPWANWNLLWWDSTADTAKLLATSGGDDDSFHPWFGYRIWTNVDELTLIVP